MLNFSWVAPSAAIILTPLVLFLLGKLFPRNGQDNEMVRLTDAKTAERSQIVYGIAMLIFAISVGFLYYRICIILSTHAHWWLGERSVSIFIPDDALALPAFGPGIGLGAILAVYAVRLFYGSAASGIEAFWDAKYRMDGFRATMAIASVLCGIAIIATFQLLCVRLVIDQAGLVSRSFFSLQSVTIPYSEILEFTRANNLKAPNGTSISRINYTIKFKNGSCWKSTLPFEYESGKYEEFFSKLEKVTQKTTQLKDFPPDC